MLLFTNLFYCLNKLMSRSQFKFRLGTPCLTIYHNVSNVLKKKTNFVANSNFSLMFQQKTFKLLPPVGLLMVDYRSIIFFFLTKNLQNTPKNAKKIFWDSNFVPLKPNFAIFPSTHTFKVPVVTGWIFWLRHVSPAYLSGLIPYLSVQVHEIE